MSYTIAAAQPGPRDEALEYDDAGPGLYPGELLVDLGDGHFAAISVEHEWPANNDGVVIKGCARWCGADGETVVLPPDRHAEVGFNHSFEAWYTSEYPLADLAKEVVLAILGEPPALMRSVPQDSGEPLTIPVVDLPADVRLAVSVRQAITVISAMQQGADLAAMLAP